MLGAFDPASGLGLDGPDILSLTGMSGVTGISTSDAASDIYETIESNLTSAKWRVLPNSFVELNSNDFGTFTVTAPNTRLGQKNYSADYSFLTGVNLGSPGSSAGCSPTVIGNGLDGTCKGTTQGPVVVPEPASGLGVLAVGAFGTGLMLKRKLKKRMLIS